MSSSARARIAVRVVIGMAVAGLLVGLGLFVTTTSTGPPSATAASFGHAALPYGPQTCKNGFVWREARESDLVCVDPGTRTTTKQENALAASRKNPNGAFGPDTCLPGFVWREAFPGDVVCVTPDRRDQARIDNSQVGDRRAVDPDAPEATPGEHTVVLDVATSLIRRTGKTWPPDCHPGADNAPTGVLVGFQQYEQLGSPCLAGVLETTLKFDEGPLNQAPVKSITKATLTYDEVPAQGCTLSTGCWRGGSGDAMVKTNGCVQVLGFPTVDWFRNPPAGLTPYTPVPLANRVNPMEWDVTAAYSWQYGRTAPLGGVIPPPFGFLLSGGTRLDQLTAEDSTACVSSLLNVKLRVTYIVPPKGGPFIPPR